MLRKSKCVRDLVYLNNLDTLWQMTLETIEDRDEDKESQTAHDVKKKGSNGELV